ncbi:MAG: PilT/PilU family type 4a pilus ATPase [Candidatus Wallbacteria bacterium]|nr:PilT/PilU family type 4a pilus ATPase [Candidatus Wallbacteria bacterium]
MNLPDLRGEDPIKRANKALLLNNVDRVREAFRDLTSVPGDEAYSLLIRAFRHKMWPVRKAAHEALSVFGDAARTPVSRSLDSTNEDEVYWAIRTLGKIGGLAIPGLVDLSKGPDRTRRLFAVTALGDVADPAIVPALIERLDDEAWKIRCEAARVLELHAGKLPVVKKLQDALMLKNENITYWALKILSKLMGASAIEPVKAFLGNPDNRLRYSAISAMDDFPDDVAVPLLIACLNDASWIVRKQAAERLLKRGERIEGFLKSAFRDGSHDVKFWSIKVLAQVTGKGRMETYTSLLGSGREDLKYYGITALGEVREPEAVSLLVNCFRDPSWGIREYASEQLAAMGDYPLSQLSAGINSDSDDVKYWCIKTLARIGNPAAVQLGFCLSSQDRITRMHAIEAAKDVKAEAITAATVERLDDPEWQIRNRAAEILARRGASAVRRLLPKLAEENDNFFYWSRKVLEQMPGAGLKELVAMVIDGSPELRKKVFLFVGELDEQALSTLMASPPPEVRKAVMNFEPARKRSPEQMAAAAAAEATGQMLVEEEGVISGLDRLLHHLYDAGGSDLHMNVGAPPSVRIHGDLQPIPGEPILTPKLAEDLLSSFLTAPQRQRLEEDWTVDFSYEIPEMARFRVNLFRERQGLNGVFRLIPVRIATVDDLRLPQVFKDLCRMKQGLVLVTGPTGSGKSTTLAAMVDFMNSERHDHIITIEDPIEFVHEHKKCLVSQREVSQHTRSFASALRSALREDPDIILVGEMRDLETISLAITASETGHLVLATLHTTNAAQTIDRIIDVFPPHQQPQIRSQLANSVQAIIAQRLLPRATRPGRVAVHEVLLKTPAVQNLIREGKAEQLFSMMQLNREVGMQTFDDQLIENVKLGEIAYDLAVEYAYDRKTFEQACAPKDDAKKSRMARRP